MVRTTRGWAVVFCILALGGYARALDSAPAVPVPPPQSSQENPGPTGLVGNFELWDEKAPLPSPERLAYPEKAFDVVVHRADGEYQFLHDNAVVWHKNTLFAAWYNCPQGEIQGSSCIRGRRSRDAGHTWSQPEVIAADRKGEGVFYVPVTFLSRDGQLWAFVSNMAGHDLVTRCELFCLDAATGQWTSKGPIAGPFLPNCPPRLMADGNFVMAGRMATKPATTPEIPAVALSHGQDIDAEWEIVPMMRGTARPYTDFPESTVWLDGQDITAVVRGKLVFTSRDFGRSWYGPLRHNLPAEDSKPFALQFSTGQRCLLWNYPKSDGSYRALLVVAVSRPGEQRLVSMWKIRDGRAEALQAGPEWSYPCAVEQEGVLYIIYTSEKRHSVMTVVPLDSLRAK